MPRGSTPTRSGGSRRGPTPPPRAWPGAGWPARSPRPHSTGRSWSAWKHVLGQAFAGTVKGRHHVPPEARRVVVLRIQRQPGTGHLGLWPSRPPGWSAEPGRRADKEQLRPSPVELLDQTRPGKKVWPGPRAELRGEAAHLAQGLRSGPAGTCVTQPSHHPPHVRQGSSWTTESRPCRNSTGAAPAHLLGRATLVRYDSAGTLRGFDRVFHFA